MGAMQLFDLKALNCAVEYVEQFIPKTPAYAWPQLQSALGCEVVVKHENHTPVGAFKVRGGLTYLRDVLGDSVISESVRANGLITATRGNHGQSIPFAARMHGITSTVLVPRGNSREKNQAIASLGAELIEFGDDFEEARLEAIRRASSQGAVLVPPFHRSLCLGVATYARELLSDHADLDRIFVPIGMGSGISGLITCRDLLGLKTKIVGVVSEKAPAFVQSLEAGRSITTDSAHTFIDGVACRTALEEPLEIVKHGAEDVLQVSDFEVAEAMRLMYRATHNVAEPAGAAALAAATKCREQLPGEKIAVILCGGNVDSHVFARVLQGETPAPGE